MMRFISRLGWIALLSLTVVFLAGFVTTNNTQITVLFWPARLVAEGEVWMFVLGAFGAGTVAGALIFWLHCLSLRARLWSKARRIAELESQIEKSVQSEDDNLLPDRYGQSV